MTTGGEGRSRGGAGAPLPFWARRANLPHSAGRRRVSGRYARSTARRTAAVGDRCSRHSVTRREVGERRGRGRGGAQHVVSKTRCSGSAKDTLAVDYTESARSQFPAAIPGLGRRARCAPGGRPRPGHGGGRQAKAEKNEPGQRAAASSAGDHVRCCRDTPGHRSRPLSDPGWCPTATGAAQRGATPPGQQRHTAPGPTPRTGRHGHAAQCRTSMPGGLARSRGRGREGLAEEADADTPSRKTRRRFRHPVSASAATPASSAVAFAAAVSG